MDSFIFAAAIGLAGLLVILQTGFWQLGVALAIFSLYFLFGSKWFS